MKLYGAYMAANPRRVKVYLAEKGIEIEQIDFKLPYSEMKMPEFFVKSPTGKIPVLELEDGTCIPESAAIIEYLEELYPEPNMIGRTAMERAHVRALQSIVSDLVLPMGNYVRHGSPTFLESRGLKRMPEITNFFAPLISRNLTALEAMIGSNPFLAGDRPTIADCHFYALAHACIDKFQYELPEEFSRLQGWYNRFSERPSAKA
jgi:glutathione S-transferase